jgi:hypothetical protein
MNKKAADLGPRMTPEGLSHTQTMIIAAAAGLSVANIYATSA